ncbi:MAG: hypothetical protein AAF639_03765 [Chloroflexota bacterium]
MNDTQGNQQVRRKIRQRIPKPLPFHIQKQHNTQLTEDEDRSPSRSIWDSGHSSVIQPPISTVISREPSSIIQNHPSSLIQRDFATDTTMASDEHEQPHNSSHRQQINRTTGDVIQRKPKVGMELQIRHPGLRQKGWKQDKYRPERIIDTWDKPGRGPILDHYLGDFTIEADGNDVEYVFDAQPATKDGKRMLELSAMFAAAFHEKFRSGDKESLEAWTEAKNVVYHDHLPTPRLQFKGKNGRTYYYETNTAKAAPQFSLGVRLDRVTEFFKGYAGLSSRVDKSVRDMWSPLQLSYLSQRGKQTGKGKKDPTKWAKSAMKDELPYDPQEYMPSRLLYVAEAVESLGEGFNTPKVQSFLVLVSEYVKYTHKGFINAKMNLPIMGRTSMVEIWNTMENDEKDAITTIMEGVTLADRKRRRKLFGQSSIAGLNIADDSSTGATRLSAWWAACKQGRDLLATKGYHGISEIYEGEHEDKEVEVGWEATSKKYGITSPLDIDLKDGPGPEANDVLGTILEVRQLRPLDTDEWPMMARTIADIAMWANELDGT